MNTALKNTGNIYLFEAGSTKTTLLIKRGDETEQHQLIGFNPNRPDNSFFDQVKKSFLPAKPDRVYFYGSGLGSDANKEKVKNWFLVQSDCKIEVYDDITGSARALYGNESGLMAIMGTGGCVAYYNGNEIESRRGGYGYLIDDLGGGFELGKQFISAWLNNDLPKEVDQDLSDYIGISKKNFTTSLYQTKDLRQVSGVTALISKHLGNPVVKEITTDYFDLFFKRHIKPFKRDNKQITEMRIVGTPGEVFLDIIQKVALQYKIEITKIVRYPASELLKFHTEK